MCICVTERVSRTKYVAEEKQKKQNTIEQEEKR